MFQNSPCSQVHTLIEQALQHLSMPNLSVDISHHVSICLSCRASLKLLGFQLSSPYPGANCQSCQHDLPAYIEQEQMNPAAAVMAYPHVWRHYWACPICFEGYLSVARLLDAEHAGVISPLRLIAQPAPYAIQHSGFSLPNCRFALPNRSLGVFRGMNNNFVLFDHTVGDSPRQFFVSIKEESFEYACMSVTTQPPVVDGVLLLTIGVKSFTARFSSHGAAQIRAIPADLINNIDAPDIDIAVINPQQSMV